MSRANTNSIDSGSAEKLAYLSTQRKNEIASAFTADGKPQEEQVINARKATNIAKKKALAKKKAKMKKDSKKKNKK